MKSYLLQTFVSLLALLCTACQEHTPPTTHHISVAIDHSEASITIPKASFFTKTLVTNDVFDGISLSLLHIGETQFESTQRYILSQQKSGWLSNEDKRRSKRKLLLDQFSDTLEVYRTTHKSLSKSDIYRTVARELNYMATQEGTRTLYLCSNLKENSSLISFYDSQKAKLLYEHPEKIQALFEKAIPLSDLSGVTLHIVYQPRQEEAELFEHLVGIYTALIKSKGGKVIVGYHHTINI